MTESERLAPLVADRVEAIVAAAERATEDYRREHEQRSTREAQEAVAAAETDARRIRQEAAQSAADYLSESRRIIDAFAADRVARISKLTDALVAQAEEIEARFRQATSAQQQIQDLVTALGDAAGAASREARSADPALPAPIERIADRADLRAAGGIRAWPPAELEETEVSR